MLCRWGTLAGVRTSRPRGSSGPGATTDGYKLGGTAAAALICALVVPALASAHIERASYWPDPAADCSVNPCAGGQVPTVRSLASAVTTAGPGVTRVVCQPDSITRRRTTHANAKKIGYVLG